MSHWYTWAWSLGGDKDVGDALKQKEEETFPAICILEGTPRRSQGKATSLT